MSVPLGESFGDADSVSLKRNSDMQSVGTTPTVTFTMPPPPTFPIVIIKDLVLLDSVSVKTFAWGSVK